jgi:hypothetical protein
MKTLSDLTRYELVLFGAIISGITLVGQGNEAFRIIWNMNRKKFDAFPKETQKMFVDLRKEYGMRYAQTLLDDEGAITNEWKTKHGATFKEASPEDQKLILEAGITANEQMFKKQESDGHKGVREPWDYFPKALKKYEAERAVKK